MNIKPYTSDPQDCSAVLSATSVFIEDLEDIYKSHSIYRAIIVTDITQEAVYGSLLEENDHTVLVINEITNIDYDSLGSRVLVMNYDLFVEFMEKHSLLNSSYNLVGITYDIDENIKNDIIKKYNNMTKNNVNNTIII